MLRKKILKINRSHWKIKKDHGLDNGLVQWWPNFFFPNAVRKKIKKILSGPDLYFFFNVNRTLHLVVGTS